MINYITFYITKKPYYSDTYNLITTSVAIEDFAVPKSHDVVLVAFWLPFLSSVVACMVHDCI